MARDEAREWLAVAEIDVKAARNCIREPEPTPEAAAYHCQQAAEKVVKAALVATGINPPRIHDIAALVDRLPSAHPLMTMFRELESLTVYGLAYRYPVDEQLTNPPMPAEADVQKWIARIEHLMAALK